MKNRKMQMENFYAAAYWGPRQEDLTSCVTRAQTCLAALATVSDDFATWRATGMSRKAALSNPPITSASSEALTKMFEKGRNRTDIGKHVIEDLGFRISVWNGRPDHEAASLSMGCGSYSKVSGIGNAVVLNLPPSFDVNSTQAAEALMTALVEPWEPEWAVVCSDAARALRQDHEPFLHKALYLQSGMALPPDLPADVVVRDMGRGRLFLPAHPI